MSANHNGYGVSPETFQAIIRERKAEKNRDAEEKRVEAIKSIRDRKSKSGINPLDQFPKEVWEMVLYELEAPKDLGNVSQVHGVFDDLLESRKIRDMLFPQVVGFPIHTDPDSLRKGIPLAQDLKMRAVSKSMRNEIDRWYEENLHQHLQNERTVITWIIPTIWFNDSMVLKGLLKNFVGSDSDEPKAKRFLQRSICAHLWAPYSDSQDVVQNYQKQRFQDQCTHYRNDVCTLLEVVGDQLWHFVYLVGDIGSLQKFGITFTAIYDTLLEYVKLMPNLKWLELRIGMELDYPEQRKEVSIASHLANHSFPFLEHLERVDVTLNSDSRSIEMFEIYEEIFSMNRHLKRLHVKGRNDEFLTRLPVTQEMDSLETLSIGEYYNCFNWHLIHPGLTFQWHLKQIYLNIGYEAVYFTDVFQALEKFYTLEQVGLNIKAVVITGELNFLGLPNLTEFELDLNPILIDFHGSSIVQFFFSLQFLLDCKKLKKLYWGNRNGIVEHRKLKRFMTNRECQERMINFRGGYRNLNYSNIWDVFPYLDTVEVDHRNLESGQCQWKKFSRVYRDSPNYERDDY